jgi:hypothetical protein
VQFKVSFLETQTFLALTLAWYLNRDDGNHEFVSGNAEHGRLDGILNTGIIEPSKSCSKRFVISISSIPLFLSDIRKKEESSLFIINVKVSMKERIDQSE